jgi:hypothetical protein
MNTSRSAVTLVMLLAAAGASADVTVQEQMNLDVASIKAHGATTKRFTSDKERTETEFSCDGFLSMLCGKKNGLEIVRLDRGVVLSGEPAKQSYIETPLPTPEQTRALEERARAAMEQLKSCPAQAPAHADVDTSKCQMSPPVINVTKADDVANIAGHDTHHTIVNMTQTCANKDSGDSCDMSYTYDVWLASDELPALAERRAFDRNYLHRLGLDDAASAAAPAQFSQFLAPYQDALRKLGSESGGLKGYPLKTTFRVAIGGPHCAAAANAGKGAGAGEPHADAGSAVGGMIGGSAGAMAGKLLGGLFGKKKTADAEAAKPADATGAAAPGATPAGLTTIAEFTLTTTSISAEAIPAAQFEMPADWKKLPPREQPAAEAPTCPKTGAGNTQ